MSLTNRETIEILLERDGDNCYICGLRMNFSLPRNHRRAPTIEHVIPRAAGGPNTLRNKKLAHRWPCNTKKAAIYEGVDYAEVVKSEKTSMEFDVDAPSVVISELVYTSRSAA